jgi:TorA maturation chaperone TorD
MHLFPSLGEVIEAPGTEHARVARMLGLPGEPTRKDYTYLFVIQLFPYASVYLSSNGLAGGRVRDDAADYFRLVNAQVPAEADHIASLFRWYGCVQRGFYGDYRTDIAAKELRRAFFWSAVGSWLPVYLLRARELGSLLYKSWAEVALDVLEAEAVQLGLPVGTPSHLQATPVLPPIQQAAAFVDALFVPVVSGLILCRADLGRCAQATGLTVRVADRRQTLKMFLTENTADVCTWLYNETVRQADNVRTLPNALGPTREYWLTRLESTACAVQDFAARYAATGHSAKLS